MSKVRIILDPDENVEEAEADLRKALSFHVTGEVHEGESFVDPAMVDINAKMSKLHEEAYQAMLKDIFQLLDKDYTK